MAASWTAQPPGVVKTLTDDKKRKRPVKKRRGKKLTVAESEAEAEAEAARSSKRRIPLSEVLQQAVDSLGFGARDARPIKMTSTNASFYFVDHAEKAMSVSRIRMTPAAKERRRLDGHLVQEWHATYSKGTDGRNLQAAAAAAAIAQCFLGDNA
eukprot:jgi/Tetstr1/424263/TSEL_014832.t1